MADLEALRRFGLVLELAEAAGDGDWAGWAGVLDCVGSSSVRPASAYATTARTSAPASAAATLLLRWLTAGVCCPHLKVA